jgi:GNAT superfamily N-acetyltransferase
LSEYQFHMVNVREWYEALEGLFRSHYAEMQERLAGEGVHIGPYAPRLETYYQASDRGEFKTFIVLENSTLIGYCTVWVTEDMHNGELIAQEDALYVIPDRRRGAGRPLVKFILDYLGGIGVKRATITPVTDLRVGKVWKRMGFKPVAELMVWNFDKEAA